MSSLSQTQSALQDALQAFSQGEVELAGNILDSAAAEVGARVSVEDALAVCCMRASIVAMKGGHNVANIMSQAGNSSSPQHAALTSYMEGLASLARGSLQSAQMQFEEAKRLDVYLVYANVGLATVFFQLKKYKQSFAQYREALSVLGSRAVPPIVRVGMGLCAYHLRDLAYAQRVLERALQVNSDDELALMGILVVYLERRLIAKVAETVMRLRRLLPHNTTVLLKVADLMYFKAIVQRHLKASLHPLRALLSHIRALGVSGEESAQCDFHEGRLLLASGDLEAARTLLESALRTLPTLLPARIHHARALLFLGNDDDALQLLLKINTAHPNQKEVLQLLATHATRKGQHETALRYCQLLTESVAQGDLRSWSLASWCGRLDTPESKRLISHVIRIYRDLGRRVPWQLLANYAVLNSDTAALQAIVDAEVGADLFVSPRPIQMEHVPLLFNLALLLEQSDRARARQLYIYLVKQQSCFQLPYVRLHLMARADGLHRQAVGWLALLQQLIPADSTAQALTGETFFARRRYMTAMDALRSHKSRNVPAALALGAVYLWCSQQHGKDSMQFLSNAKDRFLFALRADRGNVLAAHGLACCLGMEGDSDHCQSLLNRVGEVVPNRAHVRINHHAHMANVKTASGSYKQAADYLYKVQERTAHQDATLAFCLAQERKFDEAISLLSETLEKHRDDAVLQYNTALIHCAAFIDRVSHTTSLSIEDGRKLRDLLERGLSLASEFSSAEPTSHTMAIARLFLKSVSSYCLHLFDALVPRLIAVGVDSEAERGRESQRWVDTLAVYKAEAAREEEQKAAAVARKKAEQESLGKEVLEDFRAKREVRPLSLFDDDLKAAVIRDLEVIDFGEPIEQASQDDFGDALSPANALVMPAMLHEEGSQ